MKRFLVTLLASLFMSLPLAPAVALASTATDNLCTGAGLDCKTDPSSGNVVHASGPDAGKAFTSALPGKIGAITDTLIYVVGAISVIVIIIGAIRYVTSQGASDQVKQAKDTILYAIIGLIVAILAYAIVHFINTQL